MIVLIVGCAAAFYVYRNRNSSAQSAAPSVPADSPVQSAQPANNPSPVGNPTEQVKTNEVKTQGTRTESATQRASTKKTEPQQKAETIPPQAPPTGDPGHDPNRDPGRRGPPPGQPPDQFRPPPPGREPGHPPRGVPEIKTFPNGSKVIKQPDGSYIFIGPKGKTRIVPPPRGNSNGNTNQP